jgi:regulator of protease activity HflC (stomatin/prohibitin superfamily)
MFNIIEPGERGIIFRPYTTGLDKGAPLKDGFHVVAPWNELIVYNIKEQTITEKLDVLDKNGLTISLHVSVRFNPVYNKIAYLHEKFGMNYTKTLVQPDVRNSFRKVASQYTAEEIYSTKRKELEIEASQETSNVLKNNNIDMRALLIRSIILPPQIKKAIEEKLKQEQEALAYEFKLQKEKSEAERKRIAAEGEAAANKIINSSLTGNLLKMRGIEATIELSKSPNSKVVVVGGGKEGLPLILGNN